MHVADGLLHGSNPRPHVHAFQARRDLDEALQILAANFRFAGVAGDGRERTERGGMATRTGQ